MFFSVTCTIYTQGTQVFKHLQGQNHIWLGIRTKSTFKILPFKKIFNTTLR